MSCRECAKSEGVADDGGWVEFLTLEPGAGWAPAKVHVKVSKIARRNINGSRRATVSNFQSTLKHKKKEGILWTPSLGYFVGA